MFTILACDLHAIGSETFWRDFADLVQGEVEGSVGDSVVPGSGDLRA